MNHTPISNCIQETNYRHLFFKALAAACAHNREKPASLLGARSCRLWHNSTAGRNLLFPGASLQRGRNNLQPHARYLEMNLIIVKMRHLTQEKQHPFNGTQQVTVFLLRMRKHGARLTALWRCDASGCFILSFCLPLQALKLTFTSTKVKAPGLLQIPWVTAAPRVWSNHGRAAVASSFLQQQQQQQQ